MSRTVLASIITAMAQDTFSPLFLVEFEFDSGPLYIWNGIGPLAISGKTYTGTGNLLSFSQAQETSEVVSRGMEVVLSGIPSSIVAIALAEPWQGRTCTVRMGFEGSSDTVVVFSGVLDQMPINETSTTATITVNVENELAVLDRNVNWLYSSASHNSRHPNDKFFDFVVQTDREVNWGGA